MVFNRIVLAFIVIALLQGAPDLSAEDAVKAFTDPAMTDADFAFQGEFAGYLETGDKRDKVGVQIVALGRARFHAALHRGGLPGEGAPNREAESSGADGTKLDGAVIFDFKKQKARLRDGKLTMIGADDRVIGHLKPVVRKSSTMGAKPPTGAIILFDGTSADEFGGSRVTAEALLTEGGTTKRKFRDFTLHLEFRTPYMPESRGQGRGNSGCYLQGRYEVQILDSFGKPPKHDECGGIFKVRAADLSMCYPPLAWQTFDLDYTAARFEASGKKLANGRLTLRHNGITVHNNVELPGGTASPDGPEPGPISLQEHGSPVRFRNIWVVEKR